MDHTTPEQDPTTPDPEPGDTGDAVPAEHDDVAGEQATPPAPEPPVRRDSLQPDFAEHAFPPRPETPPTSPAPPPEPTWEPEPATATHGAAPLTGYESPHAGSAWARPGQYLEPDDLMSGAPLPASDRPRRRERRRWPFVLVGLLSGLVGAAATVGALYAAGTFDDEAAVPATTVTTQAGGSTVTPVTGVDAAAVARKVVPSIVTVQIGFDGGSGFELYGSGSGVVLSDDGYIVTNHHVIEDSDLARVVFQDGRTYSAEVVGSDARTDLAVLSIGAEGLTPIEIGATDTMAIGEVAIAVGNPLGLPGGASLTMGVLSAFEREVVTGTGLDPNDRLFGMLQTDAPIQQGSSGGALVDGNGRLIGITTAIGVSSAGAEGIGFAIPVELVSRVTDQLIATGTVHHAFLGVSLQNAFDEAPDGAQVPSGALIIGYAETGSTAEDAGLEIGDVIVAYDGTGVASREQLISALHRLEVGDVVILDVNRNGERLSFDVVLGERPPDQ